MTGIAAQRTAWAIAAALLTIVPLSARAQTILWVHADLPSTASVQASDEAERLLVALEAMGLLESPSLRAPAAVLASALLSDGPWTAAITTIEEAPLPDGAIELRIDAVAEIACADRETIESGVLALLARHAGAPPAAMWQASDLASGARRLAHNDLPDWRSVVVVPLDGRLIIGTSEPAVQQWLHDPQRKAPARLELFRASGAAPSGVALEAFISLNALRRAMPSGFVHGPWNSILASLNLANARDAWCRAVTTAAPDVRVTGEGPNALYRGPPLLRIEAARTSRARPPGDVERIDAAESTWPARAIQMEPPPSLVALVVRIEPESLVTALLRLHAARLDEPQQTRFARTLWAWSEEHGSRQRRLLRSLSAWTVLRTAAGRFPVMLTELRPAVNIDRVASDLDTLLEASRLGARRDAGDIWIIGPRDDAGNLVPLLHVAIARNPRPPVLVWGFDPQAVEQARHALDAP